MKQKQKRNSKRRTAKLVLRLPDLEVAKSAVPNSLSCADARRGYRRAIDEFVEWYCSEPRLSFSKTIVLRYRMHLESRNLAPGTVNLRLLELSVVFAYEAADCRLLSPDLAAGIRVKGVKKLGVRLGNWLTAEQGQALWQAPESGSSLKASGLGSGRAADNPLSVNRRLAGRRRFGQLAIVAYMVFVAYRHRDKRRPPSSERATILPIPEIAVSGQSRRSNSSRDHQRIIDRNLEGFRNA